MKSLAFYFASLVCITFYSSTLLVSCSSGDKIVNTRKGEKVIAEWLEKQGLTTLSVACPKKEMPIQKDLAFVCTALIENSNHLSIDIGVILKNDKGDISMDHKSPLIISEHVERGSAGQILDQTSKRVEVDCGLRVRMATPNSTFNCKVKGPSENFTLQITVEDDTGTWQAKRI